jgi:hypothetical protein
MTLGFALGLIELHGFLAFMAVALGLGILLTLTSVLLEEASYDTYPGFGQILTLMAVAVFENFGYRQLTAIWRVRGIWRWLRKADSAWGKMARVATWQAPQPKKPLQPGPLPAENPTAGQTRMAS